MSVSGWITLTNREPCGWTVFVGYGDTAGNFVIIHDFGMLVQLSPTLVARASEADEYADAIANLKE